MCTGSLISQCDGAYDPIKVSEVIVLGCCGLDKEEIIQTSQFIDTYETSILPYEDCCVLFSPRHPVLRGTVEEAEKIYAELEVDDLIKKAYDDREIVKLSFDGQPEWKTEKQ